MSKDVQQQTHGRKIKQRRSLKTYEALVSTGFRLLEDKDLEDISIAELTKEAGYSVGAFYARFESKDEFFEAMVELHVQNRQSTQSNLFDEMACTELPQAIVQDAVTYYWGRRRFWRASLTRSGRDPDFWQPIRKLGLQFGQGLVETLSKKLNRSLTEAEETNVYFAFQITFGTINNTIMNQPGPIFMGQTIFIDKLTRAFKLVSDYEGILNKSNAAA